MYKHVVNSRTSCSAMLLAPVYCMWKCRRWALSKEMYLLFSSTDDSLDRYQSVDDVVFLSNALLSSDRLGKLKKRRSLRKAGRRLNTRWLRLLKHWNFGRQQYSVSLSSAPPPPDWLTEEIFWCRSLVWQKDPTFLGSMGMDVVVNNFDAFVRRVTP